MESTQKVEITTELGTHLMMSLIGRKPGLPPDDGIYREKGRWGNLPAGEAYIAPVEESVNGVVIVDGSQSPLGLLSAPIRITIQDGKAIKFEGGAEAAQFERHLQSLDDPNAYWVAELGIGTNEKARVTGNILEDEKAFRTIHIAFGMNTDMGGKIESKTHDDGIVTNPTVKFDGKTILDHGNFVI
jgi:leucyl aminopeptidase (aminopeptidase T)